MMIPGAHHNSLVRCQILVEYAKWTALSAVRAGAPIRAREPIYELLDGVTFAEVLDPLSEPISCKDFDDWHRCQTVDLCERAESDLPRAYRRFLPIGWGAKLINVFLKTTSYVGDLGRAGLRDVLHPPLDNGLRKGLIEHFKACSACRTEVDFGAIKAIRGYDRYQRVIVGCRTAANCLRCSLIEVEQIAGLGLRAGEDPPGKLVSMICR